MRRGEVWWYEPPYARPRPHLLLTRDELIPILSEVLAIPATRTVRGIPTEVALDRSDGMPADCVLTADNTGPIERVYLTKRITTLEQTRMAQVCESIRLAAGC